MCSRALMPEAELHGLPTRELRLRCERAGIALFTGLERHELLSLLMEHASSSAGASSTDAVDGAAADGAATAPSASSMEQSDDEDDEDDLLEQALLMSCEDAETLSGLPVRELRKRCDARGISTLGLSEKSELVTALLGADDPSAGTAAPPSRAPSALDASIDATQIGGATVLATFSQRFVLHHASAIGRGDLDACGKVVLPHAFLASLAFLLGGELPSTLLLRLGFRESTAVVGVSDFVEDHALAADFAATTGTAASTAGIRAHLFVPRWVRNTLAASEGDEVVVSVVSLPTATFCQLQPHSEGFADALAATDDPRGCLTQLMNRFVAVSVGDVVSLQLGGVSYALDVTALRGLPHKRCGVPPVFGMPLDVDGALRHLNASDRGDGVADGAGGQGQPPSGVPVRAACLVDVDLEVDFLPSVVAEGRETARRVRREAEVAEAEAQRAAHAAEAERHRCAAEAFAQEQLSAQKRRAAIAASSLEALKPAASPPNASGGHGIVHCVVRGPDGYRFSRRFRTSEPLLALFWLVDSSVDPASSLPDDYALATSFPRRLFERPTAAGTVEDRGPSLADAGLCSAQEALFVELPSRSAASVQ